MNKQEFQQKIKDMKPPKFFNAITLREAYEAGFEEAKGNALCDSCFLNEPEKPVVPKYVADMIVKRKKQGDSLVATLVNLGAFGDAQRWIRKSDNGDTFAKAWLYGYEVENEKLYTARLKVSGEYLNSVKVAKRYMMGSTNKNFVKELKSYCYTQAELEELGVWNSPAFEIEEVEE